MQSRDDVDILSAFAQHFTRDPRARRMGNRIVAVQKLEAMGLHDLVHTDRERQVVRRELEQRVSADVDLVEENPRQKRRKPKWLAVGYEMDFMPALGESNAELGRNRARPSVRRVTGDADFHSAFSHHSRTTARARESSGFTRVTAASGS